MFPGAKSREIWRIDGKQKKTFSQTTSDQVFCYIAGVKCKLRYTVFVHSYIMKSLTALITECLCSVVYIRFYPFSEHYVEQICRPGGPYWAKLCPRS